MLLWHKAILGVAAGVTTIGGGVATLDQYGIRPATNREVETVAMDVRRNRADILRRDITETQKQLFDVRERRAKRDNPFLRNYDRNLQRDLNDMKEEYRELKRNLRRR